MAKERGNTGKSTARIARTVIIIMCDLYVVNPGRGGIWSAGDGSLLEMVGEAEGKGVPDSRGGTRKIRRLAGKRRIDERRPG